ncbi:hypothetical protein [Ectothiorhodospira lacustris]|uniref:hypothetical protein n=1 Tax=Ectothiorhodospira lacustris TaxID=2899127 RepID=UPI001EE98F9F|nr:hypothetical protein [Ectothiorhodospira lacustris]MCG5500812.1 hypothetical protein [Ectothiorhodospira lacustris]
MLTVPNWEQTLRGWRNFHWPWYRTWCPEQAHWHLPDGVRLAPRRGAPHVLSRALCRCRFFPCPQVPERERLSYVRVQLAVWAPFESADHALVMAPEGILVMAWDAREFADRCEAAGLSAREARIIPETLLGQPRQEGVSCQPCEIGMEGRVWRHGRVVGSRWWPQPPGPDEWLNFQRSVGLPAPLQHPDLPTGNAPTRLGPPWAEARRLSHLLERPRLLLHAALALGLWCLILPTAWMTVQWLGVQQSVRELAGQAQHTEREARPLLRARDDALADLTSLEYLLAQVRHPAPLTLLAHLSRQLPDDGSRVLELEWERNRLRLVLEPAADTPRTTYVKALEKGGWLQNVREVSQDRGQGGFALVAEVAG